MKTYSKKELGEKLGVTPRTIANWTRLKDCPLPSRMRDIHKNKTVWEFVFFEDEVKKWLESRCVSDIDQQKPKKG